MRVKQSLIRMNKWQVDEKRRHLSDLLVLRDDMVRKLAALEESLQREQALVRASADTNADVSHAYGVYAASVIKQRENLKHSITAIDGQVNDAEAAITEAFQALKRQEAALASQQRREQKKREKKMQQELDERALEQHRRRRRF